MKSIERRGAALKVYWSQVLLVLPRAALIFLFLLDAQSVLPQKANAASPGNLTQEQINQLVNETADQYIDNNKKQKDYIYVQREEQRKLDSKGQVKSVESRTSEVMILHQQKVERLIARNDTPLSKRQAVKQEHTVENAMEDGDAVASGFTLRKRVEQYETALAHNPDYLKEVVAAYQYKFVGTEKLSGRETYVIDGDPRPGHQPPHKDVKFLLCFRFRIWIDKAESQWVKLDADYINFFPFGLFPVRLYRGTSVSLETTQFNNEIWLPKHMNVKVDARVGLLKGFYQELEVNDLDYKKFRSDTRITKVREAPER
jgi:hypothetical protein